LQSGEWDKATVLMVDAARRLEDGSTEFFLICSNTMHHKADAIAAAVEIALLRIADPTGARIAAQSMRRSFQTLRTALVQGEVLAQSRQTYPEVIARLIARGAQAIVLGWTKTAPAVGRALSAQSLPDCAG
jgi:aspartate racemase